MDMEIVISSLESKASELDALASEINTVVSNVNSELSSMSGHKDLSRLLSSITSSTERLGKAFNNCSSWLSEYLSSLNSLESSLASFSSSNIDAPKEFSGEFVDLFGKVLMPTLKTNGDKTANLSLGVVQSNTEEATTSLDGFVDADGTFHYYNQGDYANVKYGAGTIKSAGCCPTALAMVLQYRTGKKIDPTVTASYALKHGYRVNGSGTNESLIPNMSKEYGVECTQLKQTAENMRNELKKGKVIVVHMAHGTFAKSQGHYMVLKGITSDGKAILADPGSRARSKKTWPLDLIASQTKGYMYSF